jgi:hypothetical protein
MSKHNLRNVLRSLRVVALPMIYTAKLTCDMINGWLIVSHHHERTNERTDERTGAQVPC